MLRSASSPKLLWSIGLLLLLTGAGGSILFGTGLVNAARTTVAEISSFSIAGGFWLIFLAWAAHRRISVRAIEKIFGGVGILFFLIIVVYVFALSFNGLEPPSTPAGVFFFLFWSSIGFAACCDATWITRVIVTKVQKWRSVHGRDHANAP